MCLKISCSTHQYPQIVYEFVEHLFNTTGRKVMEGGGQLLFSSRRGLSFLDQEQEGGEIFLSKIQYTAFFNECHIPDHYSENLLKFGICW